MHNYKLETKEKFFVIKPEIEFLSVKMAEELIDELINLSANAPHHIIINFENIKDIEPNVFEILANNVAQFYENNKSWVNCCLNEETKAKLMAAEMEESINYTPTESEAWDIVQMDEIERELMNDFE
jgi:anti-anti-sigma regulatory factor